MKKLTVLSLILLTSITTEARMVGPYFAAGWQYTNTRSFQRDIADSSGGGSVTFSGNKIKILNNSTAANNADVTVSAQTRGHGVRLNFGFQMNEWWAWDFAYNLFADAEWETANSGKAINRQFSLDAAGIAMFPVSRGMYATGRFGVAFLRSNIDFDGNVFAANNFNVNQGMGERTLYSVNILLGLGVSYDLNRYSAINFDVIQYRGSGNLDDATNYQVGLVYYFGM